MEIKKAGSQPSAKGPSDWFTGTVRIDPLFQAPDPALVQSASVTVEPGARTAWHTHPLGQTLIITAGLGRVQREGGQTAQDAVPSQDETSMKIRIEFNGATMTAALYDNPSARDFASMLPLHLTIDDYSTNEKTAYLPRKLPEQGSGPFDSETPGDLGDYAPWGILGL